MATFEDGMRWAVERFGEWYIGPEVASLFADSVYEILESITAYSDPWYQVV